LKFSSIKNFAYVACDVGNEFRKLRLLNLESGFLEPLSSDIAWDVNAIEVDKGTGNAAFTVNADGVSQLYVLEPQVNRLPRRRMIEIPTGIVGSLKFSPDGKSLGFT